MSHIFFREPRGAIAFTPFTSRRQRRLCSAVCTWVYFRFSALCLNLTTWFSSCGLLPVTHLLDPTAVTRCHPPVYKSQPDSLSKHTGSQGTNRKSMSCYITFIWRYAIRVVFASSLCVKLKALNFLNLWSDTIEKKDYRNLIN